MSLKNLKQNITDVNPFPNDKNVRIKIEGLAVCKFDRDEMKPSFAYFLQFVDYHELNFSVVKVAPDGTKTIVKEETLIPRDISSINIMGSDAETPCSYQHPPNSANGEYELDKLLHLSNLHGVRFSLKSDLPMITTLKMEKTSFYTHETTSRKFKVKLNNTQLKLDKLCKVLGGYIKCNTGTINISIGNLYNEELPIVVDDIPYKYEITFTNHCEGTLPQCRRAIGEGGSDVKFLYRILQPDARSVDLEETGLAIETPNVAACLPAEIEPFN